MNHLMCNIINSCVALSLSLIFLSSPITTCAQISLNCSDYGCSHGYHTFDDYFLYSASSGRYGTRYYYINSSFTTTEKNYIRIAFARWRNLAGFATYVGSMTESTNAISSACIEVEESNLDVNILGLTVYKFWGSSGYGGDILTAGNNISTAKCYLDTSQISTGTELANVCAHEIGHAYGLSHVTCRTSIMSPSISDSTFTGTPNSNDESTLVHIYTR